jgi:hypothetical protein
MRVAAPSVPLIRSALLFLQPPAHESPRTTKFYDRMWDRDLLMVEGARALTSPRSLSLAGRTQIGVAQEAAL